MTYWKFSQKSKLKQNFFTDSEKEVGNFFQDWDHSAKSRLILSEYHRGGLSICMDWLTSLMTQPLK